ncbi:MAG: Ldh family oxidoreductase [Pseudomonadota bacterium]
MSKAVLSGEDLRAMLQRVFENSKTAPHNAASVAEALVAAELAGQNGHGLRRVASYVAQAKSGKVDGYATPQAGKTAAAALRVDAAHGFAYPALDLAFKHLPAMAREFGIAIGGITRSHHCGVAGVVVERYAEEGLVALLFANTPAAMAPWGGSKGLFGTNPIAFAAPVKGGFPIVVDVSLSKVARGKIMAASQAGEAIPEGWALGPHGESTTNPDDALQGTMVPLGDAKGMALALMVELLAASLNGANTGDEASSFFEADGPPPGVGQTLIVIDPAKLGGEAVLSHFTALAEKISNQQGARVPGHRRAQLREAMVRDGVEVDEGLLVSLQAMADEA